MTSAERALYYSYNDDVFEYYIDSFSLRFGKCQHVKMYDDDIAQDQDSDSVFAMKHFIVYRLCPSDACSTCDTTFGEYVMELEEYLQYTTTYQMTKFTNYCTNCGEDCGEGGQCTTTCGKECQTYNNLEANGYVDATAYSECQQLDGGDDDATSIYIGPRCSNDGTKVVIGLFTDENCWEPYTYQNVEDVLGMKLSYHLLKKGYSSSSDDCISCGEGSYQNQGDQADADNVNEMCEYLYGASAKCESIHGLENGFINVNRKENYYENQIENEFAVCTFIQSLIWNSYTEEGEINSFEKQDVEIRETTTRQTVWLAILSCSLVGFASYVAYLHDQIGQRYPDIDLQYQSGTMS
jgi:hypothetical protein